MKSKILKLFKFDLADENDFKKLLIVIFIIIALCILGYCLSKYIAYNITINSYKDSISTSIKVIDSQRNL